MFDRDSAVIQQIHRKMAEFAHLSDVELRETASKTPDLAGWIALASTAAFRVLGHDLYDVQLRGALALARGSNRGAVWTYLTTDQPFERWKREFARRLPFAIAAICGMGA